MPSPIEIENARAFYDTYAFIFDLPFTVQKKNTLLTALMGGEPWSWRVVGITAAALDGLARHDFNYQRAHKAKIRICRAHCVPRIETAHVLFKEKHSREQFFKRFLETDVTVLALKSENKRRGPSQYVPIDLQRNLFPSRSVSFRYSRDEATYLRELQANYKTSKVALVTRPDTEGGDGLKDEAVIAA